MSQAQTTHTWLGNWNDQWNASNNWNTNTLPANGDNLIFDGNNTLTFNDLTNLLLRHITFAQTAGGAFEIDGNAFRIGGTITNNSDDEVTIWNNIQIVGGGGAIPHSYPNQTAEGLILDVGQGGMTLHGAITMDNNERNFFKYGEGTLTITGSAEVSRWLIGAGTLHVDGGTITDAGGTARTGIGSGWDPNAPETFASATLLFTNNAQATFLGTRITPYSGTNRVIIESGSVVTLQVGENNSSDFPPNPDDGSGRAVGLSILHYDITQQGSGGLYTGAAGVWSPSVSHAIVTGNTANGIKTGFGYRADANA